MYLMYIHECACMYYELGSSLTQALVEATLAYFVYTAVECQSIVGCGPCLSHAGCVFCRDEDYSGQERCGTRLVGTILMSSVFSHSNFSGNISLKTPLVNP